MCMRIEIMRISIEKLVLQTVNNSASIIPLFKTGYAYAQVFNWCKELEEKGYLGWNDDIRVLTSLGRKRLMELSAVTENADLLIRPLSQYKTDKKSIEEIYLP